MGQPWNVYCDESCHLEHDESPVMVLGAVWLPESDRVALTHDLRSIKVKNGLPTDFEIKWTKVSPAKLAFYLEVVNWFFDEPRLAFRAVVIPDKGKLDHVGFGQDHDTWYYKMQFLLLQQIMHPDSRYRIYLDIKDTRSQEKVAKLHEVLCNRLHDADRHIVEKVQQVRSHEVALIQLADLFSGALGYLHRGLHSSDAKRAVIAAIRQRTGKTLRDSTLPTEPKFNVLVWQPQQP